MQNLIKRAAMVAKDNQQILFLCFLNLIILEVVKGLFVSIFVIGLFLQLFLIAISHAEALFALKVTRQMDGPLDPKADSKVGIIKAKELFIPYLIKTLLGLVLIYILLIPILAFTPAISYVTSMIQTIMEEANYGITYTYNLFITQFTAFSSIIGFIMIVLTDWLFILMPFNIELKKDRGFKAITNALKGLKGHYFDAFKLVSYYYFFALFMTSLDILCSLYIHSFLLGTIISIALMIGQIFLYRMNYCVAKGLFYLEVTKGERYDSVNI